MRLMTLAVLFLVFVSGFLVGFAVERNLVAGSADDDAAKEHEARDDGDRRDHRERRYVIDEVELEPEQRSRVDSIIAFHRERVRELSRELDDEYRPRYREIVSTTRDAIMDVLTEAQAASYDSLLDERARRRGRRDADSARRESEREN